jgi:hypothetical protein
VENSNYFVQLAAANDHAQAGKVAAAQAQAAAAHVALVNERH